MSSTARPSQLQTHGLPINKDGIRFDPSPKDAKLTQTAGEGTAASPSVETRDTSTRLRFTSLTLEELSEELDRRTKETQLLQEEVENATKVALERFGCTSDSSPGQSSHSHGLLASLQHRGTHPLVFGVDDLKQKCCQRDISSPSMEAIENAIDDCLQQLSDLQLNKAQNQSEQETCNVQGARMNLQVQLHNVQMEKDFLSDLRLKESKKHVDQMEKMLRILEELQKIKRSADQKVQKTANEAKDIETLEGTVEDHTFCGIPRGNSQIFCTGNANGSKPQSVAAKRSRGFNNETENAQEQRFFTEEQPTVDQYDKENQQERMQNLITHLGHEMAILTDKLSSSKDSGVSLSVKLELLKKLAERQKLLYERHISDLESTISHHKHKVCCVENQLVEVHTQLCNVQRERDQSQQQAKELQSRLNQLQGCCGEQQCEHWEEVKVLKGQLESTREQLHKAEEEKSSLLEQMAQEGSQSQELLGDKDGELRFRQQETQQYLARLEELQSQLRTLLAGQKTLTLKLNDKEQTIGVLGLQMESSIQTTVQHKRTVDGLNQENSLLSNQLNQCKLEIQHLRAELAQHKSDVAAAAFEKRELQASVAEQSQRAREQSLEKQQLNTQLELQRVQLHTVTQEHKELQRLFSCKKEENKGVVLKLQSELRNAHDELDQIRGALRTLEGADGHGLRVAQDMQREVTARREQVDSMQSRIQHLEESVVKLRQEKRHQGLEAQRRLQKLSLVREERKQLTLELEALRSKDQQLRDHISELKAILHKMSESFANCQDFIQLREQEFFCLKLQHALDLKELQSPNLNTALNDSPTSSALTTPPSSKHPSSSLIKQANSTRELRSPVKDMWGVASSENLGPHTSNSSGSHRRRSAPERVHRITFADEAEDATTGSRWRRKTCGSEPLIPRTTEPSMKTVHTPFNQSHAASSSAVKYTSFLQLLSPGRRSPVYSLLTSNPAS